MDANLSNPAATLIAASQPSANNASGTVPGLAGGRNDGATGSPDAPAGESDFSSKIRSLQKDSVQESRASEAAGSGTEAPRNEASTAPAEPAPEADAPAEIDGNEQPGEHDSRLEAADESGNLLPAAGKELPVTEMMAEGGTDEDFSPTTNEPLDDDLASAAGEPLPGPAETSVATVEAADLPQSADTPADREAVRLPDADEATAQATELTQSGPDRAIAAGAGPTSNPPSATERSAPAPSAPPATVTAAVSTAAITAGSQGDGAGMNFDGGANPQPGLPNSGETAASNAGSAQRVAFSAELPALATPASSSPAGPSSAAATLAELDTLAGTRPLQPQAGQEQFARGLGERLLLMADGGLQSARIRISPENLGPLDIRIQVQDDATQVWFNASQGQTREILEQAMPRLRELLADQGMRLTDANVTGGDSGDSGETRDGAQLPERDWRQPPPPTLDEQIAGKSLRNLIEARRLLDVYA
jgi:flagellar hook-length control protein FliK